MRKLAKMNKIMGGGKLTALLAVGAICALPFAANATDLSSVPVASGTLTIYEGGEYVVDQDVTCTTLEVMASGPVTFVNPSESETNTIHVGSVVSGANANPTFNCKVAFDSAYNVTAGSPIVFAGGATATMPGTIEGIYGDTLLGSITFTENWVLPASATYTVAAGARIVGKDVSGGNASSIVVEEGASARFANATLATKGLHITVFGVLDVVGWCTCNATDVTFNKFPSETLSTGTICVGGLRKTGNKVVQLINANEIYIGAQGLYEDGTGSRDWIWFHESDAVYHATADFAISGSHANSAFVVFAPATFNTHGHMVTWTAKLNGSNSGSNAGKIVKDGAGMFVMQPAGMVSQNNAADIATMPVDVKGGVFKMGNALVTGPITVRSGATLSVADGLTIANAITLEPEATLDFGANAVVGGTVTWPEGDIYICAKESGTLIASGVTEAALEKIVLSPDSVDGTFSVSDGALVFTKRDSVIYVWQGGVDDRFSTLGNWLVDGAAAASLPHAQDIALFENTAAVTVVLDSDSFVGELRFTGTSPVTLENPSATETNTVRVGSITSGADANPTFNCRVAFDSAYNVTAESPVVFAGGATTPALGTVAGAYGGILSGDIEITANCVLPASAVYTVSAESRLVGKDVSGGNASSIVVAEGASAKFASATLATRGLRMTVFGELDIEGWLTCNAATDTFAKFPSETLSTGTIRVGGVKGTGDKVVQAFNVNDIYIGANGLYGMNTAHPDWFWLDTSSVVYHAMEDFALSGSAANSSFLVCSPITFNTHGHTVTWTAKIGGDGNGSITKDGEGVFVLQPPAVFPANQAANVSAMPLEVKSGVLRMGTAIVAGPVAVRDGATFEVAGGVTAANAVTLDSGATMDVGAGATAAGAVTLAERATLVLGASGAAAGVVTLAQDSTLEIGAGATVSGQIVTPTSGRATVRPIVESHETAGETVVATLGTLAAGANVANLALDETMITCPKGWRAKLKRDGDNLDLVIFKSGLTIYVR